MAHTHGDRPIDCRAQLFFFLLLFFFFFFFFFLCLPTAHLAPKLKLKVKLKLELKPKLKPKLLSPKLWPTPGSFPLTVCGRPVANGERPTTADEQQKATISRN